MQSAHVGCTGKQRIMGGPWNRPALTHFRSFNIWVPSTSALRIANTVWWFMAPIKPSQELLQLDLDVAYPPTRQRPPQRKRHLTDYNSTCDSVALCTNATTNRSAGSRKSATYRYKPRTTRQQQRANVRSKHDPCNEISNYTTDYIDSFSSGSHAQINTKQNDTRFP